MNEKIHAFETESGEAVVIGTLDRAAAIAKLKEMYAHTFDMDVEDKHFEDIVSRPSDVRRNWEVWDADADIFTQGQDSIPSLVFEKGVRSAWEADQ